MGPGTCATSAISASGNSSLTWTRPGESRLLCVHGLGPSASWSPPDDLSAGVPAAARKFWAMRRSESMESKASRIRDGRHGTSPLTHIVGASEKWRAYCELTVLPSTTTVVTPSCSADGRPPAICHGDRLTQGRLSEVIDRKSGRPPENRNPSGANPEGLYGRVPARKVMPKERRNRPNLPVLAHVSCTLASRIPRCPKLD